MGDRTGYATHGDYVFGWKGDSLQRAMDSSCMFQACGNGKPLLSQNAAAINKCKIKPTVPEDTEGCKLYIITLMNSEQQLTILQIGLTALPSTM
jgi:hypothetical protein